MTAPGAGEMVDAPGCTPATPCLVCRLKLTAAGAGVSLSVVDRPFRLNLVGIRRADSERNTFDDRLVAFMALPPGESKPELQAIGDDLDPLLADIAAAASAANGGGTKAHAGHGIRRVACNSIEIEPGKPVSGHRIVQLLPITTDPGLVRTVHEIEKLEQQVEASRTLLKDAEAGLERFSKELEPELKKQSEAVKAEKGKKGLKHPTEADTALKAATAEIAKFVAQLKVKTPVTSDSLDKEIEKRRKQLQSDEAALAAAQSPKLTESEARKFLRDYPRAYKTPHGWAGEQHALFPPGMHTGIYSYGFHLRGQDTAAPALAMGMLMGRRVGTIDGLRAEFGCSRTILQAREAALPAFKEARDQAAADLRRAQRELKAEAAKLPRKKDAAALAKQQDIDSRLAAAQIRHDESVEAAQQALDRSSAESYVLVEVREGSPRPPGTRVVQRFELELEDGQRRPLDDGDEIDPLNDKAERWRSGQWVREHFYSEMGTHKERTPPPVMQVLAKLPPPPVEGQETALGIAKVVKAKVHAAGLSYLLPDGSMQPAASGDVVEVQAWIGFTNLHRGHGLADIDAASPTMRCEGESLNNVRNWSTGCQVVPRFVDFNLFILLAALSKRHACLQAKACATACERIAPGSVAEPNPLVWRLFSTDLWTKGDKKWAAHDLDGEAATLRKGLDKPVAAATAEREGAIRAEYKLRKKTMPAGVDEAARQLDSWFASERTLLLIKPKEEIVDGGAAVAELDRRIAAIEASASKLTSLRAQVAALDAWIPLTAAGNSGTFTSVSSQLDAALAAVDANPAPAGSPPEHEAFRQRLRTALEGVRPRLAEAAFAIAVRAHHDWARACDADEAKGYACPQRFDYALFEIGGFATRKDPGLGAFVDIAEIDGAFAAPGAKAERNPRWAGF